MGATLREEVRFPRVALVSGRGIELLHILLSAGFTFFAWNIDFLAPFFHGGVEFVFIIQVGGSNAAVVVLIRLAIMIGHILAKTLKILGLPVPEVFLGKVIQETTLALVARLD
jgi:hypothetical protein